MGDQLSFQAEAYPWQPTEEAHLEHVFHKYNVPLAGVINQAGNRFLFSRVEDVLDDWSVWAYSLIEEGDIERLRDRDAARAYLEEETPHPIFLAVARGPEIQFTAKAPPPGSEESFVHAVLDTLEMATDAFKELDELIA